MTPYQKLTLDTICADLRELGFPALAEYVRVVVTSRVDRGNDQTA